MLITTLFPYQRECVSRITTIAKGKAGMHCQGAICALKPGCGKTLCALVASRLLLRGQSNEPLLLVGDASSIPDWEANCNKHFSPPLRFVQLESGKSASHMSWFSLREYDVIACTYDILLSCGAKAPPGSQTLSNITNGVECIYARSWPIVIFDEAHRVRNDNTSMHAAVRAIDAHFNLALTATPCNNNITDMFSLFSVIRAGDDWTVEGVRENASRFRDVCSRYLIQDGAHARSAEHFLPTDVIVRSPFYNHEEETLYAECKQEYRGSGGLDLYGREREICDGVGVTTYTPTKIRMLIAYIEVVVRRNEKANVFCYYKKSLRDIESRLTAYFKKRLRVFIADGSTSAQKRQAIRDDYERCPTSAVLVVTGIFSQGVNLHCANHSINYDTQWNPMVTDQSRGRCERPAQRRSVYNVQLIVEGTIDDHVWMVANRKRRLINAILDPSTNNDELAAALLVHDFDSSDSLVEETVKTKKIERAMRKTCMFYIDEKLDFASLPPTRYLHQNAVKRQATPLRREPIAATLPELRLQPKISTDIASPPSSSSSSEERRSTKKRSRGE